MAEAVKIAVEARDPQKNKGTGTRVARAAAGARADPGDHLRAQAGPRADLAGAGGRLGDDQEVHPPGRAQTSAGPPRRSSSATSSGTTWARRSSTSTSPASAPRSRSRPRSGSTSVALAAGVAEGGVLEQLVHTVSVTCRAGAIPDAIRVDVSELQVGQAVHVRELTLPAGRDRQRRPRPAAGPRRLAGRDGRADRGRRGRDADPARGHQARAQREGRMTPAPGNASGREGMWKLVVGLGNPGSKYRGPGTTSASRSIDRLAEGGSRRVVHPEVRRPWSPRPRSTSAASCS